MWQGCGPVDASTQQLCEMMSPGPSVAVRVPQQQALVARQHVGVVMLHHAAHTCKQNLTFQVELRILQEERRRVQQGLSGPLSQAYVPLTSSLSFSKGKVSSDNGTDSQARSQLPTFPPCLSTHVRPGFLRSPVSSLSLASRAQCEKNCSQGKVCE